LEVFGSDGDGWFAGCGLFAGGFFAYGLGTRGLRGVGVASEMGFGVALAQVVLAADLAGDGGHAVAIGGVHEVGFGEAAVVVVGQVGKVFADEGEPGGTGAGFEEEGVGAEEAGSGGGRSFGDGVDGGYAVVDAEEEWGAEDAGV